MLILDTDHFSELLSLKSAASKALHARLAAADDELAVTIVTAEELLRGWLSAIHQTPAPRDQMRPYGRLQHLLGALSDWTVLPWESVAIDIFEQLRPQHRRLGTMDLKIAAIALTHQATVLTRNTRDFAAISGLAIADWTSVP